MTVHFIGAGPGAADLITVRGRDLVASSPVCLYAGSLVPAEMLAWCPPGARLVDTARMTLDEIVAELCAAHAAGEDVARLHSGDPSLYSALAEQLRRLDEAGVPCQVTPGVPAFAAAAAALRQELTIPGIAQSVILTRTSVVSSPMPPGEDLTTLSASRATLVLHLAVHRIEEVVRELTPRYGPTCPAAVVAWASRDRETVLRGTLADIAGRSRAAGLTRTAVIIVGRALAAGDFQDSFLYSKGRFAPDNGQPAPASGWSSVPPEAVPRGSPGGPVPPGRSAPSAPRRILLLGGSGEARQLATELAADSRYEVLYSLAGRVRDPRVPSSCRVRIGGFGGPDGLAALLRAERIDLVVDATHPFAARMQASAATAAAAVALPLVVLRRPGWHEGPGDDWRRVPTMVAAVELLEGFAPGGARSETAPRVFLTTGRGDLGLFAPLARPWFLIRCVDPPEGPLPPRHTVLLDRGPFDVDAERTLLRSHAIDVVVTKDSGGPMTAAKLTAARELGLPVVLVDRPAPSPGADLTASVEEALTRINEQNMAAPSTGL
nr:cobalt-precorrin-6A reductase [Candidatus Frankia nodulisporulans]